MVDVVNGDTRRPGEVIVVEDETNEIQGERPTGEVDHHVPGLVVVDESKPTSTAAIMAARP